MTDEPICRRCGQCCKNCTHLVHLKKTTICRIYPTRLGKIINVFDVNTASWRKTICVERKDVKENFAGCPYNE